MRLAAEEVRDWPLVAGLAKRHRIEGLVHHGLAAAAVAVSPEPEAALAAEARRIAQHNLQAAAESARLAAALDAAGADWLFVKGLTLNALAYGTLAVKKSVDIDIVAAPETYSEAIAAMRGAGYRCSYPGPDAEEEEILAWAWRKKHSAWVKGPFTAELHITLTETPALLGGVLMASPRQRVAIGGGIEVPTLATEETFAYLAVHGAVHGWARLKWIADAGALLARQDDLERLHDRAVELGAGRAPGQALLLCADLLGLKLPAALDDRLRSDRAIRGLSRAAIRTMTRGGARELEGMVLATVPVHLANLRLAKGWRFKAGEIRRKFGGAPLLALPRWLLRRASLARSLR